MAQELRRVANRHWEPKTGLSFVNFFISLSPPLTGYESCALAPLFRGPTERTKCPECDWRCWQLPRHSFVAPFSPHFGVRRSRFRVLRFSQSPHLTASYLRAKTGSPCPAALVQHLAAIQHQSIRQPALRHSTNLSSIVLLTKEDPSFHDSTSTSSEASSFIRARHRPAL